MPTIVSNCTNSRAKVFYEEEFKNHFQKFSAFMAMTHVFGLTYNKWLKRERKRYKRKLEESERYNIILGKCAWGEIKLTKLNNCISSLFKEVHWQYGGSNLVHKALELCGHLLLQPLNLFSEPVFLS